MTPYVIIFITILSFLLNLLAAQKCSNLITQTRKSNMSGDELAKWILIKNKKRHIKIVQTEIIGENLYDPLLKVIQFGPDVYGKKTIYSIAVGSHEACHALRFQYFRFLFIPISVIAKYIFIPLLLGSLLFNLPVLHGTVLILYVGLILIKLQIEVYDEIKINQLSIRLLSQNKLITDTELLETKKLYRFFNYTYFVSLPLKIVLNR
ncbi:zinc metallopeptidase [Bacillus sp. DNRA2]|uniref:zinc metallopeptidase n=1 Tax=Bacillus sp. DNRA2 TaxID=2723053 RepID=UPI00145CF7E8|nr:zinc metallopeptidase [Bacillus sp. DNRA2]NMD70400.1 zinc metallopeptidase [Bacillus sp. DNRA2]